VPVAVELLQVVQSVPDLVTPLLGRAERQAQLSGELLDPWPAGTDAEVETPIGQY
jgi:hypothetical protein